jgi:predicted DNA-binding transcriptional regulator YafY
VKVSRIHRLLRLITLLQSGKSYTAHDLAEEVDVSRRTLFRDMNLLKLAGIPIYYDANGKQYSIQNDFFLPPINFTLPEVLGLMMIVDKAGHRDMLPNFKAVGGALMKIESTLPADLQEYCGSALEKIEVRLPSMADASCAREQFEIIWQAAQKQEKVTITYDSYYEGEEIQTELDPYKLMFINRAWYVIGYSSVHQETRTFKVERIIDLTSVGKRFVMAHDFDPEAYFGQAWRMIPGDKVYQVKVQFSAKIAGNVEEVLWHSTQQTRRLDDDSLLFEAEVDGVDEISWWILGYGKEARVLEPRELQELIAAHAREMAGPRPACMGR